MNHTTTTDRFDAIGQLEEQLSRAIPGLQPDWEIRGTDPVLRVRLGAAELELIAVEGGRFQLAGTITAAQAADVVKALAAPAPAPVQRKIEKISRRLAAASSN